MLDGYLSPRLGSGTSRSALEGKPPERVCMIRLHLQGLYPSHCYLISCSVAWLSLLPVTVGFDFRVESVSTIVCLNPVLELIKLVGSDGGLFLPLCEGWCPALSLVLLGCDLDSHIKYIVNYPFFVEFVCICMIYGH